MRPDPDAPRPRRFLLLWALAYAGGVVAYLPLLTLLLPIKVEGIAPDARLGVLTLTTLGGAVTASVANIGWGWASDRTVARGGTRRGWAAAGLVATALGYAAIGWATTAAQVVVAVIAWQAALNMLLAPLFAMMADEVPDARKGVAGGLLALANPLASLASALLLAAGGPGAGLGEGARYAAVCALVAVLVLPVLVVRPPRGRAGAVAEPAAAATVERPAGAAGDLAAAWLARLFVQVAGNVLFVYLFFYFESVAPQVSPGALAPRVGHVMAIAFAVPVPIAVLAGHASDRIGRRKPFLLGAAALAAAGLLLMAFAAEWTQAVAGFGVYATGSAVFLGLNAAFAMQMLPSPASRGRDLGILNLTNTLPAVLGPMLTWGLATEADFRGVLLLLAALTAGGGLLTLGIRGRR